MFFGLRGRFQVEYRRWAIVKVYAFDSVVIERQWFGRGINGLHEPVAFGFVDVDPSVYDGLDPMYIVHKYCGGIKNSPPGLYALRHKY